MKDPLVDSEILHSGESGNVEQWLEPRNKFFVFAIACLLFSLFSLLTLVLIHLHICHCITFSFVNLYSSLQEGN